MTDHPSAETRARYLRGRLAPRDLLAVDEHLAACAACRSATAPPHASVAESFREAIGGEHLTYEQMEAHVDGSADHSTHLEACAPCDAEVADLRGAAEDAQPRRWWMWAAAAAVVVAIFAGIMATRQPEPPREVRVVPPASPPVVATAPPVVGPAPAAPALRPELAKVLRELAGGVLTSAALVQELNPTAERTRGREEDAQAIAVIHPRGVIDETRPRFRWTTRDAATYVVEVFDGSYRRVARSDSQRGGEWRPAKPLPRGATYSWQVTETRGETETTAPAPPLPPAQFRIISKAAAARIRAAQLPLEKALLYAGEGMIGRAVEEMEKSPASPEIRRALETLRRYQPAPTTTKPPQ